jgi:hypothetical protein
MLLVVVVALRQPRPRISGRNHWASERERMSGAFRRCYATGSARRADPTFNDFGDAEVAHLAIDPMSSFAKTRARFP